MNANFRYIPTITDTKPVGYKGETGRIDGAMLRRYIDDLSLPTYYLSGPKEMVIAMRRMLIDNGVKKHLITTEEFTGY